MGIAAIAAVMGLLIMFMVVYTTVLNLVGLVISFTVRSSRVPYFIAVGSIAVAGYLFVSAAEIGWRDRRHRHSNCDFKLHQLLGLEISLSSIDGITGSPTLLGARHRDGNLLRRMPFDGTGTESTFICGQQPLALTVQRQ